MFGRLIARLLPAARVRPVPALRRILVIRPGGIGDAVLLVPALLDLRTALPGVHITVLAEKRNGAAFTLAPVADEVYRYDRPAELFTVLASAYDAVIDTEQWHRFSAVVARLVRAPVSVGFATNERRRLFTHPVPYSHEAYEAESFRALLAPIGISPGRGGTVPFLVIPPRAADRATALLGEMAAHSFVAIFPGASIAERRWGAANFRELVERLRERGVPVVVIGGREDAVEGERIVAGGLGLQFAGKTSLAESAAIIARSAVLISGDSGVLHLGVGLGRATVSLFGPGIAEKWAPRGGSHRVIAKGYDCSPCTRFGTTPSCRYGARCIRDITVAEVLAAVMSFWSREASAGNCHVPMKKNGG